MLFFFPTNTMCPEICRIAIDHSVIKASRISWAWATQFYLVFVYAKIRIKHVIFVWVLKISFYELFRSQTLLFFLPWTDKVLILGTVHAVGFDKWYWKFLLKYTDRVFVSDSVENEPTDKGDNCIDSIVLELVIHTHVQTSWINTENQHVAIDVL